MMLIDESVRFRVWVCVCVCVSVIQFISLGFLSYFNGNPTHCVVHNDQPKIYDVIESNVSTSPIQRKIRKFLFVFCFFFFLCLLISLIRLADRRLRDKLMPK